MTFYIEPINLRQWNLFDKVKGPGHVEPFLATRDMQIGDIVMLHVGNQYPSIETAHAAMQTDYQEELKKRHLDRSDEETIPSSYYIDTTEAAIYECQDYTPNWLTVSVLYAINEVV